MLKLIRVLFVIILSSITIFSIKALTSESLAFRSDKIAELDVFIWTDVFDVEILDKFEKETGIRVNLHFYNSNEELLAKIHTTKGKGYDVLFPSNYACKILIDQGLVKKIDKSKVPYFNQIYPFLLNKFNDPENEYSIPYIWESYGLAHNPQDIKKESLTISDLFFCKQKLVMTPDPIETICIASNCLFPNKKNLSKDAIKEIQDLLRLQKNNVEAYADFRAKDLIASGNISLTLMKTSYIDSLKESNPDILFSLPSDVIFTSIESAVICKDSSKDELIYKFFDFIFKPENMARSVEQFPMYPSIAEALEYTPNHHPQFAKTINEIAERSDQIKFFHYILNVDTIDEIIVRART